MKIAAKVKDGKLLPLNVGAYSLALQTFRNEEWFWLCFEKEGEVRSNPQNRRHFGVVVPVVREFLNRGRDVPLSKEQVHYVLAAAFAGCDVTDPRQVPGGPPVPVPTRGMNKAQFSELDEKIEAYYISEHGLIFPDMEVE